MVGLSTSNLPWGPTWNAASYFARLVLLSLSFFFFFFGLFLGLPLGHMEVPRLEVKSQPQLPVQATATVS